MASKAVVLIGGPSKGTRMRPLSLDIPKPLFPIAGRPIIWHGIQALSKVEGLKEVILIGFYDNDVINPFVKEANRDFPSLNIRYMREYQSLGTAGGLYHFRDLILKGNPQQVFVLHADICCSFPLAEIKAFHDRHRGVGTILAVKVPKETANKYGCIVMNHDTKQAIHYVEKPETFISDIINGGVYLFDRAIFDEIKSAMDLRVKQAAEDPSSLGDEESADEQLRLEQDVIAPLVSQKKLFVYESRSFWRQIKTAGSAVPANTLLLNSYKHSNPKLLRQRSPTVITRPTAEQTASDRRLTAEIVEPCFIDETATIDPTAKVGPNVSIGANVKIGFGARVKDAIILDRTVLEANSIVMHAIVSENCRIGQWARVEGRVLVSDSGAARDSIAILAKEVTVKRECSIRSCIVLPQKSLDRSFADQVLL
ncbi:uncharacterized protein L969DRAFT_95671 [Mixia osmundae IAM 14324]|uniref:mannose-1-phosphate guanylyltransferase n=1 Tax=Mixia osmundae (strain CBS 9802 / IAM 14324 / JCM 22182 / KY 12970) TaxID=764103 RepID=G7E836_MIXOS|nr:uncharacterized protein L969DRAFT_95671 [Mixia osmundae IAM 14324]KEI38596.1 hypothetical protein L969DRAFT_95671 [Mixia osmundae IAM 14324]GAA98996.1 hypothetical protein E5Q_05685 [Mixia osmundae IAM 14324]